MVIFWDFAVDMFAVSFIVCFVQEQFVSKLCLCAVTESVYPSYDIFIILIFLSLTNLPDTTENARSVYYFRCRILRYNKND